MTRLGICFAVLGFIACLTCSQPTAAQIQVTGTNPSAAPQGSVNLNVTITGSGFKKGATTQWFVTGTTNPGGVTVNSTSFNGSTQLTANITISDTANIANFDVQVTSAGRTGKGTELFAVTAKGTPIGCLTTGTPSGATLVATLNPVQPNGAALITTLRLGDAIRVRPLDLNGDSIIDTLAAFVTSGASSSSTPGTYVFLLDPATGGLQGKNPLTGAAWQNPMLLLAGYRATQAAAGDVNGDGIPDFVQAGCCSVPHLFVGSVDGTTYNPTWMPYPISTPASTAVALGDVDGIGVDEIVFGGGSTTNGHKGIGAVSIWQYRSGTVSNVRQIADPSGVTSTGFGNAVAIGNIDGKPGNELVVGAPAASTNGLVYVFPSQATQTNYFTLTGPESSFGRNLGIADANRDGTPDLVVISSAHAWLYAGPISTGASYTNALLPGEANGWGQPNIDVGDMALTGAVAVGAPQSTSCGSIQGGQGALNLFTSPFVSSQQPNHIFETPSLAGSSQFQFGYSVGIAPGYPFIVIGEHFRDVGMTSMAGQVYVYKLN